jgi:hypothetical protein
MALKARWLLFSASIACAAYGCGTLLDIQPDTSADASIEAGEDALPAESGADASADAPEDTSTCAPKSCGDLQANCGVAPDGCGQTLADCGACSGGETCGAGGPNRCGDGGCDAATTCSPGQCGSVSNGCGSTIECGGCNGHGYCNAGICTPCPVFANSCANTAVNACPGQPAGTNHLYACSQLSSTADCVHCPNPTTGQGTLYCCP